MIPDISACRIFINTLYLETDVVLNSGVALDETALFFVETHDTKNSKQKLINNEFLIFNLFIELFPRQQNSL
jgi:hypothetical protein